MVALAEQVLMPISVEARSEALELAHLALDEQYAAATATGLGLLVGKIPAGVLRSACAALRAEIVVSGARALTEASLPGPQTPVSAQVARDRALLAGPDALLTQLAGDLDTFAADAREYWPDVALPALLRAAESTVDLRALDALRSSLRALEDEVAASPRSQGHTTRLYTVRHGQDLHDIAEALYGDRDLWGDLVRDYRLYPPYIAETSRDGVFAPGDRLILPPDPETLESEGLGITFALDVSAAPRGGQMWDLIAQEGVGLAVDRGLAAFATDLALRAATPLGSLDGEPEYGLPPVAGVNGSRAGISSLIIAAEALRLDPRVSKIDIDASESQVRTGVFVANVVAIPRPELLGG